MEDSAVTKQLESIKQVLGEYNESVMNLRYDDFKSFFREQMQQAISEFSLSKSAVELEKMKSSRCSKKANCVIYLKKVMEDIITAFNNDDLPAALNTLNKLESGITKEGSPCLDRECTKSVSNLLMQVRALLEVSERFRFRRINTSLKSENQIGDEIPESAEKIIAPLSNCWRIRILVSLAEGRKSFTELSRSLGLRTGHLQFHLLMLKKAGYVGSDFDRSYAITDRGVTALKGVVNLVGSLG